MTYQIIRLKGVMAKTGLARSTIYAKLAEDLFPEPINLGPRAVGWVEQEIDDWLTSRIEARDSGE